MMKLAVPTRNTMVDDHFGHCAYYTIFTIDEGIILNTQTLPSPEGCGCKSNIASVLQEMGVSLMLAGNMGEGAKNKLNASGIQVIRGCHGEVDEIVRAWIEGNISDSGEGCKHHECL